jgi:hypothetical protein
MTPPLPHPDLPSPLPPTGRGVLAGAMLATLLLASAGPASANDRPFQVARTAVLEDDEYVWSLESWGQRLGSVRGFSFEPEYTFSAGTSVQMELSRYVDRQGAETGHEAEVEFKHLFNNIARDGYGWGLSLALNTSRLAEEGRRNGIGFKAPLSIALGESGGTLHLNAGLNKAQRSAREWVTAVAYEREVFKRTTGFVELAREGEARYAQVGVRHWLKKEKLALDFSAQQHRSRAEGGVQRASGFILGLGWYDL